MRKVLHLIFAIIGVLSISLTANAQYCASGASTSYDSNIDAVVLIGTTVDINNPTTGLCDTYSDFTALPAADLIQGQSYSIDVTLGTCGGNYTKGGKVFVDWNNDFDFLDADEELGYFGGTTSATTTYTTTFTVPATAATGPKRLRVIGAEGGTSSNITPCYTFSYGATEDYTINIITLYDCNLVAQSWDSPNLAANNLTATESVSCTVMNMGALAQSGYTVAYSIDGGVTFVTETIAASLASFDTYQHTFATTADFSATGTFNCVFVVGITCDSELSNNELAVVVENSSSVATYPYFEDFDSGAGDWAAGGTSSSWALGTPAASVINSAYSGTNSWTTNLTGAYNANEYSYVESPFFNFTSLNNPIIEFKMWYDIESPNWDGAALEYSLDGGATWEYVGPEYGSLTIDPNGYNWYNDVSIGGLFYTNGWSGTTGGWITGKYKLYDVTTYGTNLANAPSVKFRFLFGADAYTQMNGFAFDNVNIYQAPDNDAGVTSIYSLAQICEGANDVWVTVENFGALTLSSVNITWEVNGVAQTPVAYTTPILLNELDSVYLGSYSFVSGTVYTVTAATNTPSGVLDENVFNDAVTLSGLETSFSGTYSIGAGGDYATINDAITVLETLGVCAPVIFNILPGTYTGQITMPYIDGVTSTNTITFTSSTGVAADVIIEFAASSSASNWVWRNSYAEYIILDKLHLRAISTGTYGRVVEMFNANNNTVQGCIIQSLPVTSSYASGVYAYAGYPKYNSYFNNTITGGYYGMYIYGSSANNGVGNVISGNSITDFYYYGMYTYYQTDITVTNNYVKNGALTNSMYGIYNYRCNVPITVTGNTVECDNPGTTYAFRIYYTNGSPTEQGLYANNQVIQSNGTGSVYGMYIYYSTYLNIYHNSLNITGGSSTAGRGMYLGSSSSGYQGIRLLNNSVVNSGGGYAFEITSNGVASGMVEISDHNNLYTSGANLCKVGTVNVPDLASLIAMGSDSNSVSTSPMFAAYNDLHTFSPNLNAAGTPVAEVTVDIDGEARDLVAPDIGFDEYTPADYDAGVAEFVGLSSTCPGLNDVIAKVVNFGLLPITSVTINWEIDGVAQTPYAATVTIPSGGSANIVIGSYTFAFGNLYDVFGWTSLPNGNVDPNTQNDSTLVYGMQTALSGTYTIGATGDYLTINDAVDYLNLFGICGPTVFNLQTGVFEEQVTLGNIPGTSAINTLTFQSLSGNAADAIVQYAASANADNWVWRFNGSTYVTIQNLHLKSITGTNYGRVIELFGSANNNNILNNIIEAPINTSSYTSCIYNYTGLENDHLIDGNHVIGGYYSIYMRGGGTTDLESGIVITNNTIEDYYYYGIYGYWQDGIQIENNSLICRSSSGGSYGVYNGYCDNASTIVGNTIYGRGSSTTYGIYRNNCDGTATDPGLIANNFIIQANSSTSNTVYGMYIYYSNHQGIYYNTINITGGSSNYGRGIYFNRSSSGTYGNIDFANNNIVNSGGGYAMEIAVNAFTNPYITTHDYNNFYATGSNTFKVGSASVPTLTDFQLYGLEMNSISVDPAFPSFDNPHLNNGDIDGAAMVLTTVTDDIDGDVRDALTPDIGCDEFDLVMVDGGITDIFGVTAICPGITDISAEVYNYGLIDQTSVIVNWSVNGIAQTPVASTDTIAPTGTAVVYLGQYDFLNGVVYDISVWTTMPNGVTDPNTVNDAYDYFGMQTAIFGTFTVGLTGDFLTVNDAATFITTYGICGPVIFNIESGIYTDQVTLDEVPGTDSVNTVIFQSATGINTDVIVEYAAAGGGDNWVWAFNGADYVTVQNITIQSVATGNYGRVVIFQGSSNYNSVIGNKIYTVPVSSSYAACIRSYSDSKDEYNLIQGNELKNGYYSVYWYTTAANMETGNQFIDNSITDFYYYGLYNYQQYANKVIGNYIQQSTTLSSTTGYPTYIGYCDGPIEVVGNQVYDASGSTFYGLRIYYCDADATNPGLIANNMVSSDNNTGTQYGLYIYYSKHQKIYNNSVYFTTGGTCYGCYLYCSSSYGPYDFKNNSIVNLDGGYALYGSSSGLTVITSDHNNLYTSGTNLCYFSGAYPTLADWQSVSPGDVVSNNGSYYANNDLHSLSSALDGAGTPLTEVPFDFDGDARDLTTPDIGCDEFSIPANDVAVLDKMWHYGEVPVEGGADVVVGYVRNQGLNDQVNLPVTLSITGANAFTSTVVIPLLVSGDVDTIMFDGFSPLATGWNTLEITVPADDNNTNNLLASYNQATQNVFAYADTSGSVGGGGNNDNNGHIYWTKYYMDGIKVVSEIQAYITDDVNNVGNSVYGVLMDANENLIAFTDTFVLDSTDLETYITLVFATPAYNVVSNANFYAGFATDPPVGSNYFPIGYQDENPQREGAYFYSGDFTASTVTEYTNNRRWMIKAGTADANGCDVAGYGVLYPTTGCGYTITDNIIVQIQNFGSDTIFGGINASVQVDTNTVVTELVNETLAPGQIFDYTFTQTFNFFAPVDTLFNISYWVDLGCDTLNYNDTASLYEFESMYVPDEPIVTNDTVQYGDIATLYAESPNGLYWFEDPAGSASGVPYFFNDTAYTTTQLFDTVTYYVEAATGSSGIFQVGTDNNVTSIYAYPNPYCTWYWGNKEQFLFTAAELNALGMVAGPINSVQWNLIATPPNSLSNFTVSMGHTNATDMATWQTGLTQVWFDASYTASVGWNEHAFANPFVWDGVSNLVIETCFNNGSYASGGQIEYSVTPFNSSKVYRADNASVCSSTSQSYLNGNRPNIKFSATIPGCSSAPVAVTAVVQGIPPFDAALISASSPVSGIELTNEIVCVDIENWGTQSFSSFMITYEIDNGTSVTEIVSVTLNPGDLYTYCFVTPADLTTFGTYEFVVYTQLTGDGYNLNDTINFTVVNDPLSYCVSSANSTGYEEIILVEVGSMSNSSGPAFGSMYQDFTNLTPVVLSPGLSTDVTIQSDFPPGYSYSYGCWVELYIDFNHNGIYEEPSEVFVSMSTSSSNTVNTSFTVPINAQAGFHGMRVVFREGGSAFSTQPCGTYSWGETEDYFVQVMEPIPVDAGVTAILQPSFTATLVENDLVPVEVIVTNLGSDTITAMDVVFTIDGMNPVLSAYTGTLAYLESDTVLFSDIIVPGGYFDLCSYTILLGDTQPMNDTTCFQYYGEPQWDLAMVSIDAPVSGCNYGFEDVTITFENLADTVFGGITASYFKPGMTAAVDELISDTLYPGDLYTHTFATPVDLTVVIDTEFDFQAYISYGPDPVAQNDTLVEVVGSYLSPPTPVANDVTIWSGEFATLTVVNPDTSINYNWFNPDTTLYTINDTMVSPQLFDTTTYFLESSYGGGAGSLTTAYNSNNGQSGNMFNLTSLTGNVTIDGFDVNIDNSVEVAVYYKVGTYIGSETNQSAWTLLGTEYVASSGLNSPSPCGIGGLTIPLGETYAIWITVTSGTGMNYTTLSSPPYHTDGNLLIDASCGVSYPLGSSFTPRDWNGTIYYSSGNGCTSDLVPVTVFTQYADYDGALATIVSPVTGAYLTAAEAVTVDIYNNGLLDLVNFPVSYQLDNGNVMTETVAGPLVAGATLTYTFATTVNLFAFATYDLCAWTGVVNDGYTANDTLCTSVTNWDGNGTTCALAFPYLYINDPMVYGATVLPYDNEWWRFTLPIDANNVIVSLCGSSYDTRLDVYDDCNSSYLQTNDDYYGCGSSSQITFAFLSAGTYYCKVYGYNTAFGQYQLEITGEYVPVIQVDPTIVNVDCNGNANGSIVTVITPLTGSTLPFTYEWSSGETTQNIFSLTAGQYCITVTDAMGLWQIDCFDVTQPDELVATVAATDASNIGMGDGTAVLTVTGGTLDYSCQWGNGTIVSGLVDPFTDTQTALYAGIYNVEISDGNGCNTAAFDTVNTLPPPIGWEPTPTIVPHVIEIPQNTLVTLDGLPLSPGSFIGVFYEQGVVPNTTMVCGGWTYWSGMETELIAYGSDPGQDNGFAPGETFSWRVYDAGLSVEFGGSATYDVTYPNLGNFAVNGLSRITDLTAFSIVTQTISMSETWNIWSTYIDPVFPNIADILGVLATGDVEIVKNGIGQIYWPTWGINFINNIVIGEGYQMKINVPSVSFGVTGLLIAPELTPLTYNTGWSLIGYLRTSPAPIITLFSPIISCVEIVKNDMGAIYWPTWGIDFIVNMYPGEGYQLKMNCSGQMIFPPNTAPLTKDVEVLNFPVNYDEVENTGNNMSLGILNTAWNVKPEIGDEIGVFNSNGKLIGSSVYENDFTAITIWGTEILDKAVEEKGDFYTLKLWSYATGEEDVIVVEEWMEGNGQFERNAINLIEKLSVEGLGNDQYALFQNVPNPFKTTTEITFNLPEDCDVTLTVYNTLGKKVEVVVDGMYQAGRHTVEFDAGSLPSGNYFYKIITDEFVATKPMNLNR